MERFIEIAFSNKQVTFEKFVGDVAAKLATYMKEDANDAETMTQANAFRKFGRFNVERWIRNGEIEPIRRPTGRIEFNTAKLKELSRTDDVYQK